MILGAKLADNQSYGLYFSYSVFRKIDVSKRTARNWCAAGKIDGVFLTGKTWNIPAEAVVDSVIKDLFGVSGKDFQDIKSEIAGLQKGELIIKDNTMALLGISGKNYKKIKVTHLI